MLIASCADTRIDIIILYETDTRSMIPQDGHVVLVLVLLFAMMFEPCRQCLYTLLAMRGLVAFVQDWRTTSTIPTTMAIDGLPENGDLIRTVTPPTPTTPSSSSSQGLVFVHPVMIRILKTLVVNTLHACRDVVVNEAMEIDHIIKQRRLALAEQKVSSRRLSMIVGEPVPSQ